MAIQSNKYMTKTAVCYNCWHKVTWTYNEELPCYAGNSFVRCPMCNELIQINNNLIEYTQRDGTVPVPDKQEEEEMVTVTFYYWYSYPLSDQTSVKRKYLKGETTTLPDFEEVCQMFPEKSSLHFPQDWNGWSVIEDLEVDRPTRENLLPNSYAFEADMTLCGNWG